MSDTCRPTIDVIAIGFASFVMVRSADLPGVALLTLRTSARWLSILRIPGNVTGYG